MIKRTIFGIVSSFCILFSANAQVSAQSNEELVNYEKIMPAAKKYIGVPYKYGGTTASGFDCSGYIQRVFGEIGVSLPRTAGEMYKLGSSVSKSSLRVGDLVFFNTTGKPASHAGIYIGNGQFIHASSSKGITISNLSDPYYWGPKYIGAKRILSYTMGEGQFRDIGSSYWAYDEIKNLAQDHIALGYEGSYFKPHEEITRADVAALLAKSLKLNMNNRTQNYKDVPSGHWAVGAINALRSAGVMQGDQNGNFRPNEVLTRAQLSAVLVRAFELNSSSAATDFKDVSSDHWAHDYIEKLSASGITTGYADQTFKPEDDVNRSQFAAFLYRGLEK
ncbi:S-layer homology domain-containing protein [Bacillus songklensis]|uniref:S-layer homology domain-containing protein n=1 Tax=Bacillus songklensis TaxID=1069116 RepID=A0ABV8B809_9BACI